MNSTVVYGNYGREEDFRQLQDRKIELLDKILLVRLGKCHPAYMVISFLFDLIYQFPALE